VIISDYSILTDTLDEVHKTKKDEYGLKAAVLLSSLDKIFHTIWIEVRVSHFRASETLSKSLQGKDTSIQEAVSAANHAKTFCKVLMMFSDVL
jgi:adenylate cyclase